tara:strand:- start:151 stop:381 length:231 start_codon:yes stop_codon:yes gene_type:complete
MVEVIQVQVRMDKQEEVVEQLLSEQMQHQVLMELVELVEDYLQLLVVMVFLVDHLDIIPVVVEQEIKMEFLDNLVD